MDNTNINNDVLKNLPSVSRRYLKLIDQKLATYQLSSSTYYYIIKLYEFGDLTQDKLVRLTGLNPSNVTRAIQKLIFLDYIKKIQNPEDGRGFILSLGVKGKQIYPIIQSTLLQVNDELLGSLTSTEKEQFITSINKL
ncbi:MarR family winged helix-turn-helix transcriptional regulator [Lactococcus lactis]|nr:MarR family transcriptional regulator [Lactococcus lactis]KAA8701872.1 MarR family transcriptional regulator [Lactococcus lactis subsp. hordniae]MCT3134155.1 MarR family transcriptional regulator [Lactococcus lactis]